MSELLKPLVLEIWERDEECPDVYYNERMGISDLADEDKRLTPSECAAEYWCSEWRTESALTSQEVKIVSLRRVEILHRFAVLPHFDEED